MIISIFGLTFTSFLFELKRTTIHSDYNSFNIPKAGSSEINPTIDPTDLHLTRNRAYVLDNSGEIQIYQIAINGTPYYIKSVKLQSENPIKFIFNGPNVYVLDKSSIILGNFIGNDHFQEIKRIIMPNPSLDMVISGFYIYVLLNNTVNNHLQLISINIKDPGNPIVDYSQDLSINASKILKWGSHLLLFSMDGKMQIFDLYNAAQPRYLKAYDFNESIVQCAIYRNKLIVSAARNLFMYSIDDFPILKYKSALSTQKPVISIRFFGGYLYCSDNSTVFCIDIRDNSELKIVEKIQFETIIKAIDIVDGRLYLAGNGQIKFLRIGSALIPPNKENFSLLDLRDPTYMQIDGDELYLIDSDGIFLNEIRSSGNNSELTIIKKHTYMFNSSPKLFIVNGNLFFILFKNNSLIVFNFTNFSSPTMLSRYNFPEEINIKKIIGQDPFYIFIADRQIYTIDFSNIMNPFMAGTFISDKEINDCALYGKSIFMIVDNSEISVINITDYGIIEPINTINIGKTLYSLKIIGDLAYITMGGDCFSIYNISDPAEMRFIDDYYQPYCNFVGIEATGNLFYILDKSVSVFDENLKVIRYRLYSFNLFTYSNPSTVGYISFYEDITQYLLYDDYMVLLSSSGKIFTVKMIQTGSDDFDSDGASYIKEEWILHSNPDQYNFFPTLSYVLISMITGIIGVGLIVWAKRYYDSHKNNPII